MSLATFAIILTAGIYVPAFVFTAATIDTSIPEPTGFFDTFGTIAAVVGLIWDVFTLSGLTELDPLLRYGIVLTVGLMWLLIGVGQLRGSAQA